MRFRMLTFPIALFITAAAFGQEAVPRRVETRRYTIETADAAAQVRAAQQAVAASVVRVAGKDFPKPAAAAAQAKSQQSCCTPGESRKRDVLFFKQYTGYNENKNKQYGPYKLVEGSDACWVIADYKQVEMSAAGKYGANVSHQGAGFSLNQSEAYSNEYQNVRNYLLTLNLPKGVQATIEAKLNEMVKNYSSASLSISTNRATVQHTVTLWGAGLGKGRSWYEGYVHITETCCPPEMRDPAALRATLRAWVDTAAKDYRKYLEAGPAIEYRPVN